MRNYKISPLESQWSERLRHKIDHLSKPKGSLGRLEELAIQLGQIYQTLTPQLHKPFNLIFCADHGIVEEGISQSPKEVTYQVVYNMLSNGAGVCYLSRQHGVGLRIIDVGVDHDFEEEQVALVRRKIARGTQSYLHGYAMSEDECLKALNIGEEQVNEVVEREGCNILSFGEMGITNTSSSALWMHCLTGIPLIDCVGRGSGLDDKGLRHKYEVLSKAVANYQGDGSAWDLMRYFGGLEMVAVVGAMLRTAELRIPILVDGFIMTACILMASRFAPEVLEYAIFGHQGDEAGHARLLNFLDAKPLLHLGLRLGEGSGSVCAYPIVDSAARMLTEMASFEGAGVTKYF